VLRSGDQQLKAKPDMRPRHAWCTSGGMVRRSPYLRTSILLLAIIVGSTVRAAVPDLAEPSIRKFLARDDAQPSYRAVRRLEGENGSRRGWIEALTEYAPNTGLRYEITAEGGSSFIRGKVLKAVLEGERAVIASGETARSSLALTNYRFQPNGVDAEGLANILLSPRRRGRVLLTGTMFLEPTDGALVRLEGRLARSPSFWVKDVDIVRTYERVGGIIVPVALESKAQVRFLGEASFRMTYVYSEIEGRPLFPHP